MHFSLSNVVHPQISIHLQFANMLSAKKMSEWVESNTSDPEIKISVKRMKTEKQKQQQQQKNDRKWNEPVNFIKYAGVTCNFLDIKLGKTTHGMSTARYIQGERERVLVILSYMLLLSNAKCIQLFKYQIDFIAFYAPCFSCLNTLKMHYVHAFLVTSLWSFLLLASITTPPKRYHNAVSRYLFISLSLSSIPNFSSLTLAHALALWLILSYRILCLIRFKFIKLHAFLFVSWFIHSDARLFAGIASSLFRTV